MMRCCRKKKKHLLVDDSRKKRHRGLKLAVCAALLCLVCAAVSVYLLRERGILFDDAPPLNRYPCRGAYVTEKTGKINWGLFNEKYIDFVYIRSTAGAAYVDSRFYDNKKSCSSCGLPVGFVHDLDPKTDGREQALAYLRAVGSLDGKLLPILDIRRSFIEKITGVDARTISVKAKDFSDCIFSSFGCKTVLMLDKDTYDILKDRMNNFFIAVYGKNNDTAEFGWQLLAYGNNGRSSGIEDSRCRYISLCAGKDVKAEDFLQMFTVKRKNILNFTKKFPESSLFL